MSSELMLVGPLAGGLVVLSGALYALLLGLGKLRGSAALLRSAFAAYGVLFASALALTWALQLKDFWIAVIVTMLIGYLLAPIAIWHLCVGTHEPARRGKPARKQRSV